MPMVVSPVRSVFAALALLAGGVICAMAQQAGQSSVPRMVVELFTSQGCSSSPPADMFMRELADQPDVIALSFPVDYWDYLGWKDTLAQPSNAARQKAYAEVRGDHKVYTPQMIINGVAHAVGHKREKIRILAEKTRGTGGALSVPVSAMLQGKTLTISAPAISTGTAVADVIVFGVARSEMVNVTRGENAGHSMNYVNVVRSMTRAGSYDGKSATWTFNVSTLNDAHINAYAVLVQTTLDGKPGVILGGAKVGL